MIYMNTKENKVSSAVVKRLPKYYRYLGQINDKGIIRVSSGELSEITGLTASQIRQDLNHFGGFGQQGYGYNVNDLKIGKAKNLKNRVQSYFREKLDRPKTQVLMSHFDSLEYILTNSEKEALILEATLIKKHRPRYNVQLKDDKRYP